MGWLLIDLYFCLNGSKKGGAGSFLHKWHSVSGAEYSAIDSVTLNRIESVCFACQVCFLLHIIYCVRQNGGLTPLEIAIQRRSYRAVESLVLFGAKTERIDVTKLRKEWNYGSKTIQWAKEKLNRPGL